MSHGNRSQGAQKSWMFVSCFVGIAAAHMLLTKAVPPNGYSLVLLPFLSVGTIRDTGAAFSLFNEHLPVLLILSWCIATVFIAALGWAISSLSSPRQRAQFLAVHLLIASLLVLALEKMLFHIHFVYFRLHFGSSYFPTFSLPGLLSSSILLILIPYALVKFFRRGRGRTDHGAPGKLVDPYYVARNPLRTLVVVLAASPCLIVMGLTAVFFAGMRDNDATLAGVVGSLILFGTGGAVIFLVARLFWRLIPDRPIDVVYLRSFRVDPASDRTLTKVRRSLGRQIRVTGVTNPQESRRLRYLPLWIYFWFFFVLGDLSNTNVFRHNVFLIGNWKDGIIEALSTTRVAVLDFRLITDSLVWELSRAFETISARSVILIHSNMSSMAQLFRTLTLQGVDASELAKVPAERWIREDKVEELVRCIQSTLAITASDRRQ